MIATNVVRDLLSVVHSAGLLTPAPTFEWDGNKDTVRKSFSALDEHMRSVIKSFAVGVPHGLTVAKFVLAQPASEAAAEVVFSGAGLLDDPLRSRLSGPVFVALNIVRCFAREYEPAALLKSICDSLSSHDLQCLCEN